jgi:hypothetical protein
MTNPGARVGFRRWSVNRNDIFTADALAWAYFQTGQVDKAKAMMAEIARASGDAPRVAQR